MKIDLFGLTLAEIAENLQPLGFERYRAKQIFSWLYKRGVVDFQAMTDISLKQQLLLTEHFSLNVPHLTSQQYSIDEKTGKYLLELMDSTMVECVLMRQPYGNSVCVSSQAGCAMGCAFCASTIDGLIRNLSCGEILAQLLYINRLLRSEGQRADSVVLMGMGEPLANYNSVLKFIRLCCHPDALGMSLRSFTISTAGLVPAIYKLADEGLPITLAISLHAANDQLRSQLMPINNQYPISSLLAAAEHYGKCTGRRITYEYILLADVNDSRQHAKELGRLLHGKAAHVNLIPVNPVATQKFKRPHQSTIKTFEEILKQHHIGVTVRREMGTEIQAACGQLRRKNITFS